MCGRFTQDYTWQELVALYRKGGPAGPPFPDSPKENLLRLTGIASLYAAVGCTLLCMTQISRAQVTGQTDNDQRARAEVGSSLTDRSNPGLGRPNPLRLPAPLRDANGNLLHHSGRPVEVSASPIIIYPTLIPGPRIDASLLLPASMKSPILIDIDVMQAFIPWEFRVAGVFERQ